MAMIAIHFASFIGCHNKVKALAMRALANSAKPLTALDIWWLIGGEYKSSLLPLLSRWHKWGYVTRSKALDGFGNYTFHYSIARKGKRFLFIALKYAPFDRYDVELQEHYDKLNELLATGRQFTSAYSLLKAYNGEVDTAT
jgi:hypothetical protein